MLPPEENIGSVILCNTNQRLICHFHSSRCPLARLYHDNLLYPRLPLRLVSNFIHFLLYRGWTHDMTGYPIWSHPVRTTRRSALFTNHGMEAILFLLTMWNLIRSVLSTRGWRALFQRNRPYAAQRIPPLFTTFFRDGTVHYFMWEPHFTRVCHFD